MCNRRRDTATRDANTYANDHAHVQRHGDADPDSDIVAHADPDSDLVAHGNADSNTVGTVRTTATTRTDVDVDAKAASNSDAYSGTIADANGTIADANCRDSADVYSHPGATHIDPDPAT